MFSILLNKILSDIVEKMEERQIGFTPDRSNIDNISIIRQIFYKCCEHNINLHDMFVDSTQAFESVYRNKIIECFVQYKVPAKSIRLSELTLTNNRARAKINNEYTEEFKVESEV